MKKFYISKKSLLTGNYSVHRENCPFLPVAEKRIYLGKFNSCQEAVRTSKLICSNSDGCYFCLKVCSQVDNKNLYDWSYPFLPKVAYSEN